MQFIVPPGGLQGFAQMTPASQQALRGRGRGATRSTTRRKKKRKTAARKTARRASSRAKKGGRKMKFGSPAWRKKYKLGKAKKG